MFVLIPGLGISLISLTKYNLVFRTWLKSWIKDEQSWPLVNMARTDLIRWQLLQKRRVQGELNFALCRVTGCFKRMNGGLLWRLSGREPACQCRGEQSRPWSGKTSHAVGQPSLCATTSGPSSRALKPQLLSPCTPNTEVRTPRACAMQEASHCNERPVHCNEEQSLLTTTRQRRNPWKAHSQIPGEMPQNILRHLLSSLTCRIYEANGPHLHHLRKQLIRIQNIPNILCVFF